MQDLIHHILISWNIKTPLAATITILSILLVATILSFVAVRIANLIINRYIMGITRRYFKTPLINTFDNLKIINNSTRLIPSFIFLLISPLLIFKQQPWTTELSHIVIIISVLFLLFGILKLLFTLLDFTISWYQQLTIENKQPIRTYIQFIKIILSALTGILTISVLLNKSPLALLTGLGALSAILLLVFKDTITGFVSSIQVSANDLVRVGDWITIPKLHVDGDVLEILINTVKVRNFDKTIVTIPTHSLIQMGVQNWRGMTESGGRRIKRAINIDISSIKFCDSELLSKINQIESLQEQISLKKNDIEQFNATRQQQDTHALNRRQFTNIGLFRYYIESYLRTLDSINFSYTFIIRQLAPTQVGLPLEIYIFTNETNWSRYEEIQSDIFDHLLAAIHTFDLKVFQLERAPSST